MSAALPRVDSTDDDHSWPMIPAINKHMFHKPQLKYKATQTKVSEHPVDNKRFSWMPKLLSWQLPVVKCSWSTCWSTTSSWSTCKVQPQYCQRKSYLSAHDATVFRQPANVKHPSGYSTDVCSNQLHCCALACERVSKRSSYSNRSGSPWLSPDPQPTVPLSEKAGKQQAG